MKKKTITKRIKRKRNTRKKINMRGGDGECIIKTHNGIIYTITDPNNDIIYEYKKSGTFINFVEKIFNIENNNYQKIGQGSFGTVQLCYKKENENEFCKQATMKIINKYDNDNYILKEISILKSFKDNEILKKYVLEYYFHCKTHKQYYIFMEKLDMNLIEYIEKSDLYNVENNAYICDKLLIGLKLLHDKKVYHRDIKPENIMITINNNKVNKVKYIDFGLSCLNINEDCKNFAGTPIYMCPLIYEKDNMIYHLILQKVDRFALGLTFFYLFNKYYYYDYYYSEIKNYIKKRYRKEFYLEEFYNVDKKDKIKFFYSRNLIDSYEEFNKITKNENNANENELQIINISEKNNYNYVKIFDLINYENKTLPELIKNHSGTVKNHSGTVINDSGTVNDSGKVNNDSGTVNDSGTDNNDSGTVNYSGTVIE